MVVVVSQALLQAHDPGIQAKLLAMQRQMQSSGAALPTDTATAAASSPAAAVSTARSLLAPDLPISVSAARHGRVVTAEQKEEQTRQVVAP